METASDVISRPAAHIGHIDHLEHHPGKKDHHKRVTTENTLSFTGRMGTTLGDQWVPPERLRLGLFDHSRDQACSPAGLATTS